MPYALDVDSIGTPSLNPTQVLDVRSGSRVLQKEDFFQAMDEILYGKENFKNPSLILKRSEDLKY